MATAKYTDEELLDFWMEIFYQEGSYMQLNYYTAVTVMEDNKGVHNWDAQRLWRQLKSRGLISIHSQELLTYRLSDTGMGIMKKYGSYSSYLQAQSSPQAKKERIEKNDRIVKNVGILATLGVSLLTLIVTLLTKQKAPQPKKTEEGLQSIEKKLDSLLQSSKQFPTETEKQPVKDTATNK